MRGISCRARSCFPIWLLESPVHAALGADTGVPGYSEISCPL